MKAAISLIAFWVVSFVLLWTAIYLINVYIDGVWYEYLPQDRKGRIGVCGLAFVVLFYGTCAHFLYKDS